MPHLSKLLERLAGKGRRKNESHIERKVGRWYARHKGRLAFYIPMALLGWYVYGMFLNSLDRGIHTTLAVSIWAVKVLAALLFNEQITRRDIVFLQCGNLPRLVLFPGGHPHIRGFLHRKTSVNCDLRFSYCRYCNTNGASDANGNMTYACMCGNGARRAVASGRKRPGLTEVTLAVREKKMDAVVVKDLARLMRDYIAGTKYIDFLHAAGVELVSVNDGPRINMIALASCFKA